MFIALKVFSVLRFLSLLGSSSGVPTPLSIVTNDNHIPSTIFGREALACVDPKRYRSTLDIVRSCLATIFACTWVAVHPNLPGPYDSRWVKIKRRVTIMIYAMIAPEAVAVWALAQRRAARKIANEFNEKNGRNGPAYQEPVGSPWYTPRWLYNWLFGRCPHPSSRWTLAHGFLVQMGGFMLYRDNTPIRVLTIDDLQAMIDKGLVDAPTIREDEIEDKSKGDFLTKLFAVLQTSWFVFQCLARWKLGLPVTELEVVTLAFGTLNVATYSLWWKKPQNILVDIAVPLKSGAEDKPGAEGVPPVADDEGEETATEELFGPEGEKESWVFHMLKKADGWMKWLVAIPLFIVGALHPFAKMVGFDDINKVRRGALRVPMFYAEKPSGNESSLIFLLGPLFGALHLIPWTATFPSLAERWLWRSSALAITIEPLLPILAIFFESIIANEDPDKRWIERAIEPFAFLAFLLITALLVLGAPLYLLARLVLIPIAFTTLRALHEDAHLTIPWTRFFPHI